MIYVFDRPLEQPTSRETVAATFSGGAITKFPAEFGFACCSLWNEAKQTEFDKEKRLAARKAY